MKTKAFIAGLALSSLFFAGCGTRASVTKNGTPIKSPLSEQPLPNIPKYLTFEGKVRGRPEVVEHDLGSSTLVKMTVEVAGETRPFYPALIEAMDTAQNKGVEWRGGSLEGCSLGHIEATRASVQPLVFSVLFWGWDDKEAQPLCRLAMERIRREGFDFVVKRIFVRPFGEIAELRFHADPTP